MECRGNLHVVQTFLPWTFRRQNSEGRSRHEKVVRFTWNFLGPLQVFLSRSLRHDFQGVQNAPGRKLHFTIQLGWHTSRVPLRVLAARRRLRGGRVAAVDLVSGGVAGADRSSRRGTSRIVAVVIGRRAGGSRSTCASIVVLLALPAEQRLDAINRRARSLVVLLKVSKGHQVRRSSLIILSPGPHIRTEDGHHCTSGCRS